MSSRPVVTVCMLLLIGAVLVASPSALAVARWEDNGMWSDTWWFPYNEVPVGDYLCHYTGTTRSVALDAQERPHIVFVNEAVIPMKATYVRCSVAGETQEWHDLWVGQQHPLQPGNYAALPGYCSSGADAPTITIDCDNRLHLAWWQTDWVWDAEEQAYDLWLRLKYKYVNYVSGEDAWDWQNSPAPATVDEADYLEAYNEFTLTSCPVIAVRPPSFDPNRVPTVPPVPLVHLAYPVYKQLLSAHECSLCQDTEVRHAAWVAGTMPSTGMVSRFYVRRDQYGDRLEYKWLEMAVDAYNCAHLVWLRDDGAADLSLQYWSPVYGQSEVTELDPANHSPHRLWYGTEPSITVACDAHNETHLAWVAGPPDATPSQDEPFKCYYRRTVNHVWQPHEHILTGGHGQTVPDYPGFLEQPRLSATWRDDPSTPGDSVVDLHLVVCDGRYFVYEWQTGKYMYKLYGGTSPVCLQREGDPDVSALERWSKAINYRGENGNTWVLPLSVHWQNAACGQRNSMKVAMLQDDWPADNVRVVFYRCFDASTAMSPPMPPWDLGSMMLLMSTPLVHQADYDWIPRRDPGLEDNLVPPPLLFWQFDICGNLHRYDPVSQSYLTYQCDPLPNPFGDAAGPGEGYWLSAFTSNRHRMTYEGVMRTGGWPYGWPQLPLYDPEHWATIWEIPHEPGWSWMLIGTPTLDAIPLHSLKVRNDATEEVKWWYEAAAAGWVQTKLYFYDPFSGYQFCGPDPWDADNALRPWRGYWAYFNPSMDLGLYIPLHRDLFNASP